VAAFQMAMAPGDGSLGSTSASVLCVARDGVARELTAHEVLVTRTVVADDTPR
jgi:hypothetical protein